MSANKNHEKSVDDCGLCFSVAENPVVCHKGHVYCKTCIYENLLTQKSDQKSQQAAYDAQTLQDEQEAAHAQYEASLKDVISFQGSESSITGRVDKQALTSAFNAATGRPQEEDYTSNIIQVQNSMNKVPTAPHGYRVVPSADGKYVFKRIGDGQAMFRSIEPYVATTRVSKPSSDCHCPIGDHVLKVKHLRPVKFTPYNAAGQGAPTHVAAVTGPSSSPEALETARMDEQLVKQIHGRSHSRFMCPCCLKGLTRLMRVVCVRTCGHVICGGCYDKLMCEKPQKGSQPKLKPRLSCAECDTECTGKDVVQISAQTLPKSL
jgi:nitric oxide synthase-interacting protein